MKIKMNWGNAIVLAFALFISFILYFVFKVQSDSKYDNELVVEEYYKHDAHFQDELNRIQNAYDLKEKPLIEVVSKGVRIRFPELYAPQELRGTVALYRASNKKFDFHLPLSFADSAQLFIPKDRLIAGEWYINMEWKYQGKAYLTKQKIYIK